MRPIFWLPLGHSRQSASEHDLSISGHSERFEVAIFCGATRAGRVVDRSEWVFSGQWGRTP